MSLTDIRESLKNDFQEEIRDANKYFDMAKNMCEHETSIMVSHLYEMAKDEYTHAMAIKDYFIDSGVYIPTEQLTMFDELTERIYRKFR